MRNDEKVRTREVAPWGQDDDGSPAVGVLLYKEAGINTVQAVEAANGALDELRTEYPELTLAVAFENASFIQRAIDSVVQNILIGGLTNFADDGATLRDILDNDWIARFAAGDNYDEIVGDLVANRFIPGVTVFDDGVKDKLKGSKKARDLFFADIDEVDDDDDKLKAKNDELIVDLAQFVL